MRNNILPVRNCGELTAEKAELKYLRFGESIYYLHEAFDRRILVLVGCRVTKAEAALEVTNLSHLEVDGEGCLQRRQGNHDRLPSQEMESSKGNNRGRAHFARGRN